MSRHWVVSMRGDHGFIPWDDDKAEIKQRRYLFGAANVTLPPT
jgi:hypothetical protein